MNYRHAFHAGSHADVVKHAVLALALEHLKKKEKPFAVLDAHAGAGVYDLDSREALRTLEWREGVGRLYDSTGARLPLAAEAEKLLAPWRGIVETVNEIGAPLSRYPGSPEIFRRLLRRGDRLIANELHPEDWRALARHFAGDRRVRTLTLDAGRAIKANVPPPQRRGLILMDPPYEKPDEMRQAVKMLDEGYRRFATGVFCLWYPVTGDKLSDQLVAAARTLKLPKTLRIEVQVRRVVPEGGLAGAGLIVVNPPWPLDTELRVLIPALTERLAQGRHTKSTVAWLAAERLRPHSGENGKAASRLK